MSRLRGCGSSIFLRFVFTPDPHFSSVRPPRRRVRCPRAPIRRDAQCDGVDRHSPRSLLSRITRHALLLPAAAAARTRHPRLPPPPPRLPPRATQSGRTPLKFAEERDCFVVVPILKVRAMTPWRLRSRLRRALCIAFRPTARPRVCRCLACVCVASPAYVSRRRHAFRTRVLSSLPIRSRALVTRRSPPPRASPVSACSMRARGGLYRLIEPSRSHDHAAAGA